MKQNVKKVTHQTLPNGLQILVYPITTIPKVVAQIWYRVGSKHEKSGERGLAHLLEHMLFKGTERMTETDMIAITDRLSGECNAFTSYDFTAYHFEFPKQNWVAALDIFADTMSNCTFKSDLLNSEMKAVIQELKLYKDNYEGALEETMLSAIFAGHPYHHPIIGYKQDLWSITRENLLAFYKKYYMPNNAILVVVGDVQPDDVVAQATTYFASIPAGPTHADEPVLVEQDIAATSTTLYREIEQPFGAVAYTIPGLRGKNKMVGDALAWVIANGKGSRLYKKLVLELNLATHVQAHTTGMFDADLLFITFEPVDSADKNKITTIIAQELESLGNDGCSPEELERVHKKLKADYVDLFECNENFANELGQLFLATNDPNYLLDHFAWDAQKMGDQIKQWAKTYLRRTVMNTGFVVQLDESDADQWLALQELSDEQDARILSQRVRESRLEPHRYAHLVHPGKPAPFTYPSYAKETLANGCSLLWHHREILPKIDLILEFKAKYYDDPIDKQGLNDFVFDMLLEGTKQLDATAFAQAVESRGMSVEVRPGHIMMSMFPEDFAFGLELLGQMVTDAVFDPDAIERVREQMLADIRGYWDDPLEYVEQRVREAVYGKHPYSKNPQGSIKSIESITRQDLIAAYKKYVTPHGARLAVVGDLQKYDLQKVVANALGSWQGVEFEPVSFPSLDFLQKKVVNYPVNRDQMVFGFGGLSVARHDSAYEPLLIFDQYFTGGLEGSMSSRLFLLREETGLFYTIGGSLIMGAAEQPGMIYIRTLVSQENIAEFQNVINEIFKNAGEEITPQAFEQARNNILNGLVDHFESGVEIAQAFLFLEKFNLPADYFATLGARLGTVTLEHTRSVVKQYLDINKMVVVKIGRMNA